MPQPLDYKGLISLGLSEHTRRVLNNDGSEILTFFINNSVGLNNIDVFKKNSEDYEVTNQIRINSVDHNQIERLFIKSIFNKLDYFLDIDFVEMNHNNGSDIDIYSVKSSSGLQENALGQIISQTSNIGSWWDIFWKKTDEFEALNSNDKNTILHEIGHALGLSHPFEDPFNKLWNSDDTIMSYNIGSNGWNTWYSEADIKALLNIWGRENDNENLGFSKKSISYKFRRERDTNRYFIKSEIGDEEITNVKNLLFTDQILNIKNDIVGVFEQIKGIDHITGKVYRLYNAAFDRFPDRDGLEYWIEKNLTQENDLIQTTKSFIKSEEFINTYGGAVSNREFVNVLYANVLNREPDIEGLDYWVGNLNNNIEERYEVLLGFSESTENKTIFKIECGL